MEDKKVALTDYLVKPVSWTNNNNVNKLGYTLMQLVTGKSCNLPGLTIGKVVTESVSDTQAVQRVIERLLKTQAEFREAEMRVKLKDCQKVQVRDYLNRDKYVKGTNVYYQYQD